MTMKAVAFKSLPEINGFVKKNCDYFLDPTTNFDKQTDDKVIMMKIINYQ